MSKGKRRERQAAALYERAGYATYRPQHSKWGETDMFNLFDILAIHPERLKGRLCQVKANRSDGITEYFEDAQELCGRSAFIIDYLVAHDNQGWRWAINDGDGGYAWICDERDEDGAMGDEIVRYLGGEQSSGDAP